MKQSISHFFLSAFYTVKRFPLVCLVAFLGSTVLSLMLSDGISDERQNALAVWAQTFALGIPLFFASTLFAENLKGRFQKIGVYKLATAIQIVVYFHLNHVNTHGFNQGELSIAFVGYFLAFHLLVSFLPLVRQFNSTVFWHFNKTLFLRAAITGLYVAVLFAGLAGALVALDQLLGFNIKSIYYGRLWFYMAGLGSVWMFLAHIPRNLKDTIESGYPKGLQVFAQYILMPLVLLYLVILYVYGIKIIVAGTLPIGWVSNLILAFSVVGMLALLLLHPLTEKADNIWVNRFTRGYYLALIPLLVLLFIAAFTRINAYGFTELRYALLALAIWLSGITAFMLITHNRFIWAIPVSLFLTVLWVFFIPGYNLHEVSKNSQSQRLHELLKENNMFSGENELVAPAKTLPDSVSAEIFNITKYLSVNHGITGLEPTVVIPDSFFVKSNENRSKWDLYQWLETAVAPYGISDLSVYTSEAVAEAVAEDTAAVLKPLTYPDLEIRFRGPTPAVVSVPNGNWSHCVDLNLGDLKYIDERNYGVVKVGKDALCKNLRVSTSTFNEVFNLDSLMGVHVHTYKFPDKKRRNPYFFPNRKEVIRLDNAKTSLQVFYLKYGWNTQNERFELAEINGKLWIR